MSEYHEAEVHMDNGGHTHDHTHDHGDAHGHSHEHGHSHDHDEAHDHSHAHNYSHTHDPQQTRAIINRLKRSIGHLDKVRRMVEDGEDCADVLIQLSAVKSEINNTGKLILKQHMEHCIVEAVRENDQTSIDKMNEAIDRFMK
jgi:DNA-binding FrmR family transcriptional regulator